MLFSTLLTLAVVGCTPKGNTDGDGDGHFADTAGGDDCDDTNGTVHPGATETCNGIDDNCDSHVDEALGSPYYADADGDTFGDLAVTQTACTAPEGYVSDSTDCQDDEAAAFPGADEQCDGIDNNCDGSVDEPTATGATEWYPDGDEDGYGDPEDGEVGCTAPADMIAQGGDCDDDDAARNPGAEEVCNTVDDNCDGTTDGADEVGSPLWYLDSDGDQFGDATVEQAACTRPDGYVQDHTDCDDAVATTNPSAAEYCNGADDNCDAVVDEATAVDASVWYADADSDSHGDPFLYQTACSEPLGYVADYTDCDDADPNVTEGCAYTRMTGGLELIDVPCTYSTVGSPSDGTVCPTCDFSFDTTNTLVSGSCISEAELTIGYIAATGELDLTFSGAGLGPFPATLTPGAGYDILDFSGPSRYGSEYSGTFYLY